MHSRDRKTESEGVLMFLARLMISVSRGTPRVTFFADTPAKWKVLRVIWVVGSPMDWAATVPMASPEWDRAWLNLFWGKKVRDARGNSNAFEFVCVSARVGQGLVEPVLGKKVGEFNRN